MAEAQAASRRGQKGRLNLTPNQVVAYNLKRARELRGWTQAEAAKRVAPYLGLDPDKGEAWSRATWSAAEKSFDSKTGRIRQFEADEIVAFAQAFDLSISDFFLPPETKDLKARRIGAPGLSADKTLTTDRLTRLVLKLPERLSSEQLNHFAQYVRGYMGGVVEKLAGLSTTIDDLRRIAALFEVVQKQVTDDITEHYEEEIQQTWPTEGQKEE